MNSCWRAKLGGCSNFFLFDPLHQLFALFPHVDYINLPFLLCGFFLGWTKGNRKNQNGEEGEARYLNFSPSLPFWYISCCSGDPLTNSHTGCPLPPQTCLGSPSLLCGKDTLRYTNATNSWLYQSSQPRNKTGKLGHIQPSILEWSLPEYYQVIQLIPCGSKYLPN